ncbi:recombinase family protein [Aeromonas intestinalis]
MKSYLYSRISTLQQVSGFGIARQILTITDFLDNAVIDSRLGYQLDPNDYEILESDIGKSAFKGSNWQPNSNLGRFYDDVISKRITSGALIVENIDRLTRLSNYQAAHKLTTLITHGIDIIEVESGTCFSMRIPESNSILNMSISRAHNESKRKSNMGQKTWANRITKLRDEGKASVKICPRWLTVQDGKYILDTEQAAILLSIHQQYLDGHGSSAIVRRLNDEGKLNNGKPWNTLTLHKVLKDERLTGKMVIGKQRIVDTSKSEEEQNKQRESFNNNLITVDNAFPVVVDPELFNRVQSKINPTKHGKQKPKTTKLMRNLFNGISFCGVCGNQFIVCTNGRGTSFYSCLGRRSEKTCINVGVNYYQFETSILKHIKELNWSAIYTRENDTTDTINECRMKIADVESKISELNKELIDLEDDDLEVRIIRIIKKNKGILNDLVSELNGLMASSSDGNVAFNPDLELVHDQANTHLRQDTNVALRKVIKQIAIVRDGNLVQCWIKYYTDYVSHLLIFDITKKDMVSKTCITNDGVFYFDAGSIDIKTGKLLITGAELRDEDKIALELWLEMFEKAGTLAIDMAKNNLSI